MFQLNSMNWTLFNDYSTKYPHNSQPGLQSRRNTINHIDFQAVGRNDEKVNKNI